MIVQATKRITDENVSSKEALEAVNHIGLSLNTFIEEIYTAVMGSINIKDNLNQSYKTLTITVDSNGIPLHATQFRVSLKSKVVGIQCVRALENIVVSQPFVSFIESSGTVHITHIAGLTADTQYQLVLLVLGD